jgi:hypothetical protein
MGTRHSIKRLKIEFDMRGDKFESWGSFFKNRSQMNQNEKLPPDEGVANPNLQSFADKINHTNEHERMSPTQSCALQSEVP